MEKVKKVTLSGMLFAIGLILPFFIGQIPDSARGAVF